MSLHRVQAGSPIVIKQIIEGKKGDKGKDGVITTIEKVVHVQEPSEPGRPGKTGATPEHEVRNGEIRFKNPDGTWGEFITIRSQANGGGGLESVKYTSVQAANFKVTRTALIVGTNIFGVNFAGDVELILPSGIDKNIIIVVKDESNNAGTNNITITTENP